MAVNPKTRPVSAPDPNGPPAPVTLFPEWFSQLGATVSIASFVGAGFMLLAASTPRHHGATRSAHLVWQARQHRIEQALLPASVAVPTAAPDPGAEPPAHE